MRFSPRLIRWENSRGRDNRQQEVNKTFISMRR